MVVGYMAGKYPGRIGWLISPGGWRQPHEWLPYAIDNGAFPAWAKGEQWDQAAFYAHCDKTRANLKPLWIAVPDVVADKEATIESWHRHHDRVNSYGVCLAFVVQDGMTPSDVPGNADIVFVGGTTEWKWRHLRTWTDNFPRVHVGRVNTERMLWICHDAEVESCDGTGWFRGDRNQLAGLFNYLEQSTSGRAQLSLLPAL
jgi:hypothetical protein